MPKITLCKDVAYQGGYPLVVTPSRKVHALVGAQLHYQLLCGMCYSTFVWAEGNKEINCKICLAMIAREEKAKK